MPRTSDTQNIAICYPISLKELQTTSGASPLLHKRWSRTSGKAHADVQTEHLPVERKQRNAQQITAKGLSVPRRPVAFNDADDDIFSLLYLRLPLRPQLAILRLLGNRVYC